MRMLYNAALLPLRAASVIFGAWPRSHESGRIERDQRLGRHLPVLPPGAVWIHGASVGEARLTSALAQRLRAVRPALPIAVSAVTPAGRGLLPAPPAVDGAFFLPLDFPAVQRRAFDALRPGLLVLVETELWPNLLAEAAARGVPVVMVNARLAPERLARYRRLRGLYAPLLQGLAAIGAPTAAEAERFAALGVSKASIHVIGNLKFDLAPPAGDPAVLRARLGLPPDRPVVVAGSTGEAEDPLVLEAFAALRAAAPRSSLVLAPRHATRFESAAKAAIERGWTLRRLSEPHGIAGADVVLVDTHGELAALYAIGAGAFVGGSLVPVGGHNLLEPLAAGTPVLFGPHTHHVAEIAEAVVACGAGVRVDDAAALGRAWSALVADEGGRAERAHAGRQLLAANRGANARAAALILGVLDRARKQDT